MLVITFGLGLFPMVQRYKFESKSQLCYSQKELPGGCFQWFKDTNLKVNHNNKHSRSKRKRLFPMVQRYKFESKSQHGFKASYHKYFLYLDARWYMDKELFDMKEVQMRFEDKRRKIRGTDGERQLPSLFPENELNEVED